MVARCLMSPRRLVPLGMTGRLTSYSLSSSSAEISELRDS